ncbi:hypothetical protein ABBQ38_012191 [Trebouxia sp. C0009 RCD-2024]
MLDAMDVNPYSFVMGIVYLAAAFPLTYSLFVTSAFIFDAPVRGPRDGLTRAVLACSFLSFPVLIFTAGVKLLYVTGDDWADFAPALLPLYSVIFLAANKVIAR